MERLPDVSAILSYDPLFIDPSLPSGLWFCDSTESAYCIKINAVCLRTGGNWDDLSNCAEFFGKFQYILIVCPDEERRAEMQAAILQRVNVPVLVAETKAFRGCKSVMDLKAAHGQHGLDRILLDVRELPAYGLINVADIKFTDYTKLPGVLSGFPELDRTVGKLYMGMLSVWTGKRGSGKSTILGQLLLNAIDRGLVVCAYSGELDKELFKQWIMLQAAGTEYIEMKTDKQTGKRVPTVPYHVAQLIDEWWDKRLFLFDVGIGSAHDEDGILRVFEYAHRRYGADVFLVDNIMTVQLKGARDADYFRAQSNFVGRLVAFSKKHKVHVHMVAHPRKTMAGKKPEADDVGGAGDITNRADNVFSIGRKLVKDGDGTATVPVLSVLKNRVYGELRDIPLQFDAMSKRFYSASGALNKRYAWALNCQQMEMLPSNIETPFDKEEG